jgi:integrase/recombinase XerD
LFLEFAGDVDVAKVTTKDIRAFLAWLRTDYRPKRFSGDTRPLSRKTVRNVWATLSGFFRWAALEFELPNPMMGVPAPKFETAPVKPFSKESVEKLLKACKRCRESQPLDRRRFTTTRATFRRDQAHNPAMVDSNPGRAI